MSEIGRFLSKAGQIAKEGLFDGSGPQIDRALPIVATPLHRGLPARPTPPVTVDPDRSGVMNAEIIVEEQLEFLAQWCDVNDKLAKKDRLRYWALKIPALLSAASVSALESFGYGKAVIILGVVTAFCVGMDAAFPGGQLYNIHKRATNEIRRLQHSVLTKWRLAQLEPEAGLGAAAKSILADIQVAVSVRPSPVDLRLRLGQAMSRWGTRMPTPASAGSRFSAISGA